MGNRGWATRDKVGRRFRIWLSQENWDTLYHYACVRDWPLTDQEAIEGILRHFLSDYRTSGKQTVNPLLGASVGEATEGDR